MTTDRRTDIVDHHRTSGTVLPFLPVRGGGPGQAARRLLAYWEALRGGRQVPLRSEIDPRGIEGALEQTFLVERLAPGVTRFRVAGMALADVTGGDVRGLPLSILFTPAGRDRAGPAIERVFCGPAAAEFDLVTEEVAGPTRTAARLLLLPLRSDLGDISRAIGCIDGVPAVLARRAQFGIRAATLTPLAAGRALCDATPEPGTLPGFAEPPAPFKAAPLKAVSLLMPPVPAPITQRGHLSLVTSRD